MISIEIHSLKDRRRNLEGLEGMRMTYFTWKYRSRAAHLAMSAALFALILSLASCSKRRSPRPLKRRLRHRQRLGQRFWRLPSRATRVRCLRSSVRMPRTCFSPEIQ